MHEFGSQSTFWHAANCATVLSARWFFTRFLVARCVASTCWFCYIWLRNENHVFIVQLEHAKKWLEDVKMVSEQRKNKMYKKKVIYWFEYVFCAPTNEENEMESSTSSRQISTRQTPNAIKTKLCLAFVLFIHTKMFVDCTEIWLSFSVSVFLSSEIVYRTTHKSIAFDLAHVKRNSYREINCQHWS